MCCSPLLVGVLQVGRNKAGLKLRGVFGVVYSCWEHLGEVGGEGAKALREMSVETLVQEDQVYQAIMENERLLRPDELQEKRPDAQALALVALHEEGSVSEPQHPDWLSPWRALRACGSRMLLTAMTYSEQKQLQQVGLKQQGGERDNDACKTQVCAHLHAAAGKPAHSQKPGAEQAGVSEREWVCTLSLPLW